MTPSRRKEEADEAPSLPGIHMAAEPKEGWDAVGHAYEGRKRPVMQDTDYRRGGDDG